MSITDQNTNWVKGVQGAINTLNQKIFRQLIKHINLNPINTHHIRLQSGLFSLIEKAGTKTDWVLAYTYNGHIELLDPRAWYNNRRAYYEALDTAFNTTSYTAHEVIIPLIRGATKA